jgi:hypothetical protein
MDTRRGIIDEPGNILGKLENIADLEIFEHGELIQIKSGWFQITKIDIPKQRLTLKPVPRPEKR